MSSVSGMCFTLGRVAMANRSLGVVPQFFASATR